MSDQSRDRVEGTFDDMKGRGKSAMGELTGDDEMKAEGATDRAMGAVKKGLADAKDALDTAVKKVTGD
ncbi:MAG: CsbD-like [Thermomicrobiales bacterium]|nr:CsbD-like [Thermomicrobiales bacterium]MEA2526353.1 CsbD-like [Thermomicrobiales bacterium]